MTKLIASVLTFALASRSLGIERFGDFVIIFAYIQLFNALANFGVDNILIRDLAQPELERGAHRVLVHASVTSKLLLAIGVSALGVSVAVALNFSGQLLTSIVLFSPFILVTAFGTNGVFGDVLQARGDNNSIAVASTISAIVVVVGTAGAALLHASVDVFLLVYTLSNLVDAIICILTSRKFIPLGMNWSGPAIRYLLAESFPLAIGSAFVLVYGRIDTIMLEKLTDPQQVALYGVAYKFFDVLSTISATIMIVVFPSLARAFARDKEGGQRLYSQVFILMAALAIPMTVGVVVFRSLLLSLVVGEQYLAAGTAMPGLMLAIALIFPSTVASYMLIVIRKQRWNFPMAVVASILNIGLNLLLIPRFGFVAAAWVTAATEVFVIIFNVAVVAFTGHMIPSLRKTLGLIGACLPLGLAFLLHIPSYVGGIAGLLLFGGLLFVLGVVQPAQVRALLSRTPAPASAEAEDLEREYSGVLPALQYVAMADQPTMQLAAVRPGAARDQSWQTSARLKAVRPENGSQQPRQTTRGKRSVLIAAMVSLVAISAACIILLPFGVEVVALLVFAVMLASVAIRPQWGLYIFVVALPLHNLLMALLFESTGDATFVKLAQPWKEVVLGIALLRAGLPAVLEWWRTRRVRLTALDILVLLFCVVCALSVVTPSHIVPLTGKLLGFRQLVAPFAVYFLGRLAPPTRRELQWLVGALALIALVFALVAVGERTVWGDGLFVALNYGSYNATFFNFESFLPYNMGATFFTGTPNWLPRAGSLAVNPLDLASLLVIALPIVLAAMPAFKERNARVWRLLMGLTAVMSGAALVLAFGRMSLLLLPVELLLVVVLLGIRSQWRGVVLVGLGVGIGISLFLQTSAYVLAAQNPGERVARSNQGVLASGVYTWLDVLVPILTICGVAAIVVALITGISAMIRRRRASLARATLGGLVGVVLIAACLFVPPLALANSTGMFAPLIHDTPIAKLTGIPPASWNLPNAAGGGKNSNPSNSGGNTLASAISSDNTSTQGHFESYKRLPGAILHHPLGYGIGSAGAVGSRYDTGLNAESAYLPVGVELGLPGLLLYLGIFLASLFAIWNAIRSRLDPLHRAVFVGVLAAWVFVLVDGVVAEITLNFFVLYVMLWLTGSAVTLVRQSRVVPDGIHVTFQSVRPLRIAMDVQCLRTASTGVRVYVDELLARFGQHDAPHVVAPISGPKGLPPTNTAFRAINQGLNLLWVHVLLPIRLALGNYDVLFSPEYLTPIWAPVARVVTYHDSTFLQRPQDYNRVWHLMYRLITIPATRRAEAIVTPSHFTATEASRLAHFDPGRIHVTPMGLPQSGTLPVATRADQIVSRFGVASGAYLLHVGVLEHRKNLETLVRGFALWRQQGGPQQFKLVLVGHSPVQPTLDDTPNIRRVIAELGLEQLVVLTGRLTLEERDAFYARAAAYVLPSKTEGFGFPVLEAFAAKIPLVCSSMGALPEVAGDAALFFDPSSPQELADRLKQLADDPRLRSELVRRGSERLAHFTWDRTAQRTYGAFEAAAVRAYAPSRASDAAPSYTIDKG